MGWDEGICILIIHTILVQEIQYHTLGNGPGEVGFGAFHLVSAEADSDTQVSSIIDSHLNIPPKKSSSSNFPIS